MDECDAGCSSLVHNIILIICLCHDGGPPREVCPLSSPPGHPAAAQPCRPGMPALCSTPAQVPRYRRKASPGPGPVLRGAAWGRVRVSQQYQRRVWKCQACLEC
ncbi:hypothetical protein B0H67DRAFT_578346 [Lasiosphaeris hirsuta]|uniref:Uncharacterized protein n=1 Tax=Lasiosphaeris hirsuta TaxID=260670 RepID=A0AA40AEU4_9PEZI|nr:hypothetical protein B0H67DRAFT_578346 [Lasiosphaeris hirsuta]